MSRKSQAPARSSRVRGFEALESRQLMAGDINFNLVGGNLTLTGDNQANGIVVRQVGFNKLLLVGAGSTIKGQPFQVVNGVSGNVQFNMNGGNDFVIIDDGDKLLSVPAGAPTTFQRPVFFKDLILNMGDGADAVEIDGVTVNIKLKVDGGFGTQADQVKVNDTRVIGAGLGDFTPRIEIDTNGGNDFVRLVDSVFNGLADIDTGAENDTLEMTNVAVETLGDLKINTQAGNDFVKLDQVIVRDDLELKAGNGDDQVQILRSTVADILDVELGAGNDLLLLFGNSAKKADLDGQTGQDKLTLSLQINLPVGLPAQTALNQFATLVQNGFEVVQ